MSSLDKVLAKDVDEFAKELAEMVAKRFPPALEKSPARRVSPNRITKVLEDTLEKAQEYGKSQRLSAYKKARLANSFRWQLKDLGYSDKFVEVATEGLVVYVTRGGSKPGAKPGA